MHTKRLGFLSAFAVSLSLFSVSLTSQLKPGIEVAAEKASTVYLRINSQWASAHHYAAYFFANGKSAKWVDLSSVSNGLYSVTPPEGYEDIIFCSLNKATNDWDNVTHQTADLKIDEYGDNCFTLFNYSAGYEEKSQGTWHTLSESLSDDGGQANISSSKNGTYYQLLVYSFADGDGDGIGDFKGIVDHLDYLKKLGIGGLWLSPIQKAGSYHGYDILDYYAVNPDYVVTVDEVTYDLNKLVEECHKAGIKVILDLVLNHCSYSHPWVTQHPTWFTNDPAFDGMKDFNLYNSEVSAELKNIGKYWLVNYGLDGYRLDAVKWLFNSGGMGSADDAKNIAWLREFYDYCTEQAGREVYMVGENYTGVIDELAYYHTPIDSSFNFGEISWASSAFVNHDARTYMSAISSFQNKIIGYNAKSRQANFLSNHDGGRFFQSYPSVDKYLFMSYLSILSPGNSFVYYGDEINLQATVTYNNAKQNYGYEDFLHRTPMPFASGRTDMKSYLNGFSDEWRPYVSNTSVPLEGGTADDSASNVNSFYAAYAEAIRAKNAAPVLYDGTFTLNNLNDDARLGSYIASKNGKSATVIFNASENWIDLDIAGAESTVLGAASFHGRPTLNGSVLTIAPLSATVLDGSHSFSIHSGGSTPEPGPEPEPGEDDGKGIYLRGSFNSWVTSENYRLKQAPAGSNYSYYLSNVRIIEGQEFKVADADWDTYNLGYNDRDLSFGDMNYYFNDHGVENDNIKCTATGYYDFYMTKGASPKIAAFKAQHGELRGVGGDWMTGITATTINPWNEYVAYDVHINAGDEFQIWIKEWDDEYTCFGVVNNEDASSVHYPDGYLFTTSTDGRNVKATVEGDYNIRMLVTGGIDWDGAHCDYYITLADSDYNAAVNFAKGFNTALSAACDINGNSDKDTVVAAWSAQATAYGELSTAAQTILAEATAESESSDLATFAAKYQSIYAIRGESWSLENFLGIEVVSTLMESQPLVQNHTGVFIILVTVAVGGLAIAVLWIKRRRKN